MSRKRPGTTSDLITHLSYIYIKCAWKWSPTWPLMLYKHVGWAGWIRITTGYKSYHYVKGEARNHFRLDKTSNLYMYKAVKHLLMQWMAIWMHPYFIKAMEVGWSCWTWVTTGYKPYHYDMGEAKNHFRMETLPSYLYKVFKHLLMQWMVIWMHPYFIKPMEVCQAGWTWVTTVYKPY